MYAFLPVIVVEVEEQMLQCGLVRFRGNKQFFIRLVFAFVEWVLSIKVSAFLKMVFEAKKENGDEGNVDVFQGKEPGASCSTNCLLCKLLVFLECLNKTRGL